jgi:hypothetical protein
MGRAVDTVLCASTQAGAAAFPTTIPAVAPDSLVVRNFAYTSKAFIQQFLYGSNAVGQECRITSPLLHDNVTGLTWFPPENPAGFLIPPYAEVEVQPQDTLLVQGSCGAATTITAGVVTEYENLRGADADLRQWHDIKDRVEYLKCIQVANLAIAVGAWTDTLITNSENQLHADHDYAILGIIPSVACDIVGVKGEFTNNLRVCMPGLAQSFYEGEFFLRWSEAEGRGFIPVFNANDRNGVYISAANHAAIAAAGVQFQVIVAQLKGQV